MFMKEWVRFSGSIIQTSFLQEVHALLPLLQSVFLGYMAILGESLLYLLSRQLFLGLYLLSLNPADLVSCKLWDFPVLGLHQPSWKCIFTGISWEIVPLFCSLRLSRYLLHFITRGFCESYLLLASLSVNEICLSISVQMKRFGFSFFFFFYFHCCFCMICRGKKGKLLYLSAIFRQEVLGLSFTLHSFVFVATNQNLFLYFKGMI